MDKTGILQSIDVDSFRNDKVAEVFPCFMFTGGSDPFVVIYNLLQPGDIPLVVNTGKVKKTFPNKISGSAYNVQKLLYVLKKITYFNEKGESFEIRDVIDYLDAVTA